MEKINFNEVITSGIIMLFFDYFYLSTQGKHFNKIINNIQGSNIKFKLEGAIVCYIFLIVAINYFIINEKKSINDAFLLGLCIYSVYESTNYAIIDKWNGLPVYLDAIWGGILFSLTTYFTYELTKK